VARAQEALPTAWESGLATWSWDLAWQNVELAVILQDLGSRQALEQESCIENRKQPLGWLELGKDAATIPWLEHTRALDEAEKRHGDSGWPGIV